MIFSAPFILLLRFYKSFISPFLPGACRFYPTCSDYAAEAFRRHGVFKGFFLTAKRLLKCAPYHPGGVDYVPPLKIKNLPSHKKRHCERSEAIQLFKHFDVSCAGSPRRLAPRDDALNSN